MRARAHAPVCVNLRAPPLDHRFGVEWGGSVNRARVGKIHAKKLVHKDGERRECLVDLLECLVMIEFESMSLCFKINKCTLYSAAMHYDPCALHDTTRCKSVRNLVVFIFWPGLLTPNQNPVEPRMMMMRICIHCFV